MQGRLRGGRRSASSAAPPPFILCVQSVALGGDGGGKGGGGDETRLPGLLLPHSTVPCVRRPGQIRARMLHYKLAPQLGIVGNSISHLLKD